LALSAELYEVRIPEELSQGISGDVDFIGSVSAANALGERLNSNERKSIGSKWRLYRVAPEEGWEFCRRTCQRRSKTGPP
jgi:hypothetical protein